ncbi:MAG: efflux RND transporter periplasmic adaptor subunit [Vicinamibacterales bacterium]
MSMFVRLQSALVLTLALVAGACSSPQASNSATDPANGRGGGRGAGGGAPVPVTTAHVVEKPIPVTISTVGTTEAIQTVQIRSQVTGQLSQVLFAEGQEVRKGQLLFTIDPRPFQAALAQAHAVLARDTATSDNAAAEQARYQDLFNRGLLPKDQYEAQAASAASAKATLEADRAAVDTAKLNLDYTQITAPVGGRTGSLGVHTGDLIRANDTNPMVVINEMTPIYVTFAVPGRYLQDIHKYQSQKPLAVDATGQPSVPPGAQPQAPSATAPDVPVQVESGPTERGSVSFIDNSVDPSTDTIKLKATFPNADRMLWPGLFMRVTLFVRTEEHAIVVPMGAIQASQNGTYAYVVKPNHTVEMRSVVIQRQQGEEMVIAKGLTPGDVVVTDGQLRLTPGARVTEAGAGPASNGTAVPAGRQGRVKRGDF